MGQYFQPCILAENKKKVINWMYSHNYDNGLKLMEHSYLGNDFVSAFETLIANKPQRVVWAGDYAGGETKNKRTSIAFSSEIIDFIKENISGISSAFVDGQLGVKIGFKKDLVLHDKDEHCVEKIETVLIEKVGAFVLLVKDYEEYSFSIIPGKNIKDNVVTVPVLFYLKNTNAKCEDKTQINPAIKDMSEFRYIVNHDKKQFVDKTKVPDINGEKDFKIHPLPLLTCEGNGSGGGDFHGEDKRIGTWARDLISVEREKPADYKELIFDLVEG
jgi:hypothetical protein